MDLYMDEKWKLSKKGSRNASSRREQTATSSTSSSSSAAGGPSGGGAFMKRSSSMPENVKAARNSRPGSGPSTNPRNFTRRCANLVKEQRAKFYIMRRCVTMLICWRDYP